MKIEITDRERLILARHRSGKRLARQFYPNYYAVLRGELEVPRRFCRSWGAPHAERLTVGEVALILRHRSGLSLRQMAEGLGVSHQTLWNWEHGVKGDPMPVIRMLTRCLAPGEWAMICREVNHERGTI